MPESPWVFHIQMKQTAYTLPSSILRLFPSEDVLQYVKTWDNYRSYLASSHTSLYCPVGAQPTGSPWRQRCVHALWSYLLRADLFCSSARSTAVTKTLLSPGATEMQLWLGRSLQHLRCFRSLPLAPLYSFALYCCHSWFDFTLTKALCCKETQKNSAPIPPIPASILLITQHSTDSPEAAENWFLHPVLADNGCPHQELDHLDVYWWFGCRMMGFS